MSERERVEQTIAALEAQRAVLGDAVVDTAVVPLHEKLAVLAHPPAAEERQLVTVLFADLAGFTARAEQLDAEQVRDLLDEFWMALDPIILEHGGYIHRHMGDGVVAVWGWHQAREDDPAPAVRAALALQEAMVEHEPAIALDDQGEMARDLTLLGGIYDLCVGPLSTGYGLPATIARTVPRVR